MNIDFVVEEAKRLILRDGELPFSMFVELDSGEIAIVGIVNEGETVYDRAYGRFLAGRAFARKKLKKQKVVGLYQAAKAWMAPPGIRPSQHPERREVLVVDALDAQSRGVKQESVSFEIIRDGAAKLIDLLRLSYDEVNSYGVGLPSFLAGVRTAKQDQSLAIHAFREIWDKYSRLVMSEQG